MFTRAHHWNLSQARLVKTTPSQPICLWFTLILYSCSYPKWYLYFKLHFHFLFLSLCGLSMFKTPYSVLNTCRFLKSSKSLHVSAWIGHPQVLIIFIYFKLPNVSCSFLPHATYPTHLILDLMTLMHVVFGEMCRSLLLCTSLHLLLLPPSCVQILSS
jgi:hypothetical protein